MRILILAEHDGKTLSDATARTLAAAQRIGGDIDVLVAGSGCAGVAGQAAALAGVRRVRLADANALANRLAEPLTELILTLAGDYDVLMAPATSAGKNVMPRVAALLDVMQISEIVSVEAPDIFKRPIYAGNAIATVQATDAKTVITVRPSAFEPVPGGEVAPVEPVEVPETRALSHFVSSDPTVSDRPDLSSARIVVSGGRALGSRENFDALIGPLAEKLGAAVGASRAAVDSGFVSNDCQVGQTGKVVAPDLYIACGISGAIQHLAGMKEAKVIVAINSDPEAPIFSVADFGLVADIFAALPELTEKL